MLIAMAASLRSEDLHRQVGAVGIDASGMVVGTGYNGLKTKVNAPLSFWKNRDKRRLYCIHAEINLLRAAQGREIHTVACTTIPCVSCAQALSAFGVKNVLYLEEYERDRSSSKLIFKKYGVKVTKVSKRLVKSATNRLVKSC
jgi:dCMP deaminase